MVPFVSHPKLMWNVGGPSRLSFLMHVAPSLPGNFIGIHISECGGGELSENKVLDNKGKGILVQAPPGKVRMQANRQVKTQSDDDFFHELELELELDPESASTQ